LQHVVEHVRYDCGRNFGDRASRPQQRYHGTFLSLAPVLPQHDATAFGKAGYASWCEEMKTRGDLRRLMPSDRWPVRPLAADMVGQLRLGNPVRADPGTVGLELPVDLVEFSFQDLGPLVELKLCKALREDGLHLIEWVSLEQIQHHRITDHELAVDGFGVPGQSLRNNVQVDVRRGSDDRKAHE